LKRVNSYKVYLVGLGKPGDNSIIIDPVATFDDSTPNLVYYYFGDITLEGHKNRKYGADTGQPNWQNGTDLFIVDSLTLWNDTDGDNVVDQEWNDLDADGIVDSPEWTDTNGNFIVDEGEWTDTDFDGIVDSNEWVDTDGDFVVDNEQITYTNEWVLT